MQIIDDRTKRFLSTYFQAIDFNLRFPKKDSKSKKLVQILISLKESTNFKEKSIHVLHHTAGITILFRRFKLSGKIIVIETITSFCLNKNIQLSLEGSFQIT